MLPSVSFSVRRCTVTPSTAGSFVPEFPFRIDRTAEPSTIGAMGLATAVGSKSGTAFNSRRRSV
ncbi:PEP-CTERM sorting domain-containing protein [Mesorhizobium sp. ES1-4]|uniref:PEP-CTERM sorting domain-containing protein n=1 Tax=Mesorhizobium sp. ES1-4 TaxID=2876627 RepID=UPI001CC94852|nr:PEP-CTERM sorting domain-containing protein [Mesorhizobium sp. ES1-4]